jgi:serine/threonine protein kinase
LDHPAILGIVGFAPFKAGPAGGEPVQPAIYTEWLAHGSLSDVIYDASLKPQLTPTVKAKIAIGVALAMRFMHACDILHLDLKPGNVLLDDNWEPCLGDMGSSRQSDWSTESPMAKTHLYVAPELVGMADLKPTKACDVFSYAVLLWELETGIRPYPTFLFKTDYAALNFYRRVDQGLRPNTTEGGKDVQEAWLKAFLDRNWDHNDSHRDTFEEIVESFRVHDYRFVPGVETAEVQAYVARIEEFERSHPPVKFDDSA